MKKTTGKVGRQIFVFTPEEKKAAACVLGALLLGLATKHYRDTHPVVTPKLTPKQQYAAQRAAKASSARARSARGQREAAATATPAPDVDEED
ncbi:MAG: hypothetical protein M3119_02825 [Verrucomicrobiota bacterium]|nr:hypothetical protein [Verrucomicrobiota bacterium]